MNQTILKQYSILVEFLGKTLGPDYEVVLHDTKNYTNSIVAIANGHISGRTIGAPMTNFGLNVISDKSYKNCDYKLNYNGISKDQRILRSSTMFIKDENEELVGMLCINFDDRRYVDISNQILKLCHPDELVEQNSTYKSVNSIIDEAESFSGSIAEVTSTVLKKVLSDNNIPIDRLTQDERLRIVDILNQKGIFMLKGAVSEVAKQLHCSEPSIYRYLNKLQKYKED
ncbi:helix-turn-helix transcriptional regulator [Crassaminicella indica]|uniref:PAS domain-containing protein n=1 Tax=Crassaminicella indica TaxID=2855394 RepID=A0ABX8RBZ1_9CLOT|nr:PAS domain-containing protein [Crassaminicella indica]QXM06543.1 PAS domain-containing protein [Crassaminicella indica]